MTPRLELTLPSESNPTTCTVSGDTSRASRVPAVSSSGTDGGLTLFAPALRDDRREPLLPRLVIDACDELPRSLRAIESMALDLRARAALDRRCCRTASGSSSLLLAVTSVQGSATRCWGRITDPRTTLHHMHKRALDHAPMPLLLAPSSPMALRNAASSSSTLGPNRCTGWACTAAPIRDDGARTSQVNEGLRHPTARIPHEHVTHLP